MDADLLHLEDALWLLVRPTGNASYDLAFDRYFACRRPFAPPAGARVVLRIGAIDDHAGVEAWCAERGLGLVQSEEEHLRASELPRWQPRLAELTPASRWFDAPPAPDEIAATLGWPIFMKGARQTSRHQRALHLIDDADAYVAAIAAWQRDPILHWQPIVCRQRLRLRPVPGDRGDGQIPPAFELRAFFWRGQLAAIGRYWWQAPPYAVTPAELAAATAIATEAARRVDVPFLVVDVAQDVAGRWWVIECNDGQEAGHAAISPFALWPRIVELERATAGPRSS